MTVPPNAVQAKTGSLWRDGVSANFLFSDDRARFPGDLLTVVVEEDSSGSRAASTDSERTSEMAGSLEEFFGLPQQFAASNPTVNPSQLVRASASREWDADASTRRTGQLRALMTVEVKAIAANGNLFVQGDKIVSVNQEDQHIQLSGWVRPRDIDASNQVKSSRLANARIDYFGVGAVGRTQRAAWGSFLLDFAWPF